MAILFVDEDLFSTLLNFIFSTLVVSKTTKKGIRKLDNNFQSKNYIFFLS